MTVTGPGVWRRTCPAGQVLDLLHARVTEAYAPHVHEEYAVGACTAGREVIRYRGALHYAGPGSVVVLEPGEAHTGAPADPPDFTYRVMYPAADLLSEGMQRPPRFREPVVADPGLAAELRRLHAALGSRADPLEGEARLVWLLGELVRRHASPSCDPEVRGAGRVTRLVMAQLADRLVGPPALAEIATEAGRGRGADRVRGPGASDQMVPAGGRGHPGRVPQQRSRQRPAVPVMLAFTAACRWRPTSAECGVR